MAAPVYSLVYDVSQLNVVGLCLPLFGLYCIRQAFNPRNPTAQMFMLGSPAKKMAFSLVFAIFSFCLVVYTTPVAFRNVQTYMSVKGAEDGGTLPTVTGTASKVDGQGFCVEDICLGYEGSIASLKDGAFVRAQYLGKQLIRLETAAPAE